LKSNETNLIERFRNGDDEAFDELYRRMHERIYRFALRLTGKADDAEDVTVLTFTEAYRSRDSFRIDGAIDTWMYRIAVHMAARQRRQKRHERIRDDVPAVCRNGEAELHQMLGTLPEHLRAAFVLVKIEGLTSKEAAEVLRRRQGTIQSHVFQASRALREMLLHDHPNEPLPRPEGCTL
jgi:RNA polymerase sigma-70 factor (ECF subfamily)